MNKDKQIEEMAKGIDACPYITAPIGCDKHEGSMQIAEYLTQKSYRKASEVANEIYEEVLNRYSIKTDSGARLIHPANQGFVKFIAELKKKYTEGEG